MKNKAEELYNRFASDLEGNGWQEVAKNQAVICVEEIEKYLIEYGKESNELQNMEGDFRYLNKLKEEIWKI